MANPLDFLLAGIRRKKVSPTETIGAPGTAIYGGYIQENETNVNIGSKQERHKTYSEILANAGIVAAGIRYFLSLTSKAQWSFTPSEADTDGKFAELAEAALLDDPRTPWPRIIRRAAMFRFYGYSVQEWTAKRHDDGHITFLDIAPRAQLTLEKWDMATDGQILGVIQRNPQNSQEIYLPRSKILYIVDDTLSDSPEGLGLFRHLVSPAQRLFRYEQLEGFGFETDLRGVPIGRGPFTDLAAMVTAGTISAAQRTELEAPMRAFMKGHVKTPTLALLLDSKTYEAKDEAGKASMMKMWDIELMKGESTSFKENAAAIERLNRELARILGVEHIMLGSDSAGSFALSADKTNNFFLVIDAVLEEIKAGIEDDLLGTLWMLNGWPKEMMPKLVTEAVRRTDAQTVSKVLTDIALAGAPLDPKDPIIDEVRDLMGMDGRSEELIANAKGPPGSETDEGDGDGNTPPKTPPAGEE